MAVISMEMEDAVKHRVSTGNVDDDVLRHNMEWLLNGKGRPHGCPAIGRAADAFLEHLEEMRGDMVDRLDSAMMDNGPSLLTLLRSRLAQGPSFVQEKDVDVHEEEFNQRWSDLLAKNESDHTLFRWLLEAEFIEQEHKPVDGGQGRENADAVEARTPDRLPSRPSSNEVPLLFTADWPAIQEDPDADWRMGPAARLFGYWFRGEYLGSLSLADQKGLKEQVKATHPTSGRKDREYVKRARLHAIAKVSVQAFLEHDGMVEKWTLQDPVRTDHQASESKWHDETFHHCAQRCISEELGLERNISEFHIVGETTVESGQPGSIDSRSMPGLPTLIAINRYALQLSPIDDPDLFELKHGLPARAYKISDAGEGIHLAWAPAAGRGEPILPLHRPSMDGVQARHRYALPLRSNDGVPEITQALAGLLWVHHSRTDAASLPLCNLGDKGTGIVPGASLFGKSAVFSSGGNGERLGIDWLKDEANGLDVCSLVRACWEAGVLKGPGKGGSSERQKAYKRLLGNLSRLLHSTRAGAREIHERVSEVRGEYDERSIPQMLGQANNALPPEVQDGVLPWLLDPENWRVPLSFEELFNQPSVKGKRDHLVVEMGDNRVLRKVSLVPDLDSSVSFAHRAYLDAALALAKEENEADRDKLLRTMVEELAHIREQGHTVRRLA